MARQLRVEYEGAIYHVMSRGDRKEPIFEDDEDRLKFLRTLGETCERADWRVHAYCLMGNHFHLVVETAKPTLVSGMKWFLGTYTQRFNARHRVRGHLFAGRYKSLLVDGSDDFYLRVVCDYVHLNPLRVGMLGEGESLEDYAWSSFPEYLKPPRKRVEWLRVDRLLGEHGIRQDNSRGRRELLEIMATRCAQEGHAEEKLWSDIRRGWRFGAEDFVERIAGMGQAREGNSSSHLSDALEETMEEKARAIIRAFLEKRGIGMEAFLKRRKGDPSKVRLAGELRRKTTMTMAWIAKELNAGVPQTLWKALWVSDQKCDNTRD
ncbi:MAG: transposase [Verrucomicrobia bacterium]|nr:transposase [Verrucomicrobiota bacterium]